MKLNHLIFVLILTMLVGCIRLVGKAGYVKETPTESTSKSVGFDTDELFDSQKAKGNVTT